MDAPGTTEAVRLNFGVDRDHPPSLPRGVVGPAEAPYPEVVWRKPPATGRRDTDSSHVLTGNHTLTEHDDSELLTFDEAGLEFGISRRTLERMRRVELISTVPSRTGPLVRRGDLRRVLESMMFGGPPPSE